jgi:hypothetical protein
LKLTLYIRGIVYKGSFGESLERISGGGGSREPLEIALSGAWGTGAEEFFLESWGGGVGREHWRRMGPGNPKRRGKSNSNRLIIPFSLSTF